MKQLTHFIYIFIILTLFICIWLASNTIDDAYNMLDKARERTPQEKQCYATYGTHATWDWECKTIINHK